MAEPCDCTWDDNRDSALLKPEITYCPMHAAAGNMLAALEAPYACADCYNTQYSRSPALILCLRHEARQRQTIAAARSGAPRPDVLGALKRTVTEQAEDVGLWFVTNDAATAYVQAGLRRLHDEIEAAQARGGGA